MCCSQGSILQFSQCFWYRCYYPHWSRDALACVQNFFYLKVKRVQISHPRWLNLPPKLCCCTTKTMLPFYCYFSTLSTQGFHMPPKCTLVKELYTQTRTDKTYCVNAFSQEVQQHKLSEYIVRSGGLEVIILHQIFLWMSPKMIYY